MMMITEPLEFEKPIVNLERQLNELRDRAADSDIDMSSEMKRIEDKLRKTKTDIYRNLSPWQRVQIARHTQRPFMLDYVEHSFDDFLEIHGDRHIGDDEAMPCGFAYLEGRKVVVIGHQKGRDTKENLRRNFGSAHPEGYRKALRLMRMAEKFRLPIVTLIDTPGAYPGIGAEERNIAEAIAFNLREMMTLTVPIVAVVIGEGGSGGALGIGVADRVLMMENAYYSVISPEGCAAILWKDRKYATEAAQALKLSANDLLDLGIIDQVIPEPMGGAHHDHVGAANNLKSMVNEQLLELDGIPERDLLDQRYDKYRKFGEFREKGRKS
ncbi:MAG: acetyl-CoA carboxylase carboxyltransferase subunit alpha [Verrucomicrobiales bacterium]|jgi:acetyl-CoA carboxylase carboxyl transferase subunit alpha|nr:acetyl-CoA carboxylase carboxyltransferase subunit alpha [Verrucomicrobiales bacterium]